MIDFLLIHPDANLGELPGFIDEDDPRPAVEQLDANYQHGGGWRSMPGLSMRGINLHFAGDPPYRPIAIGKLRDEIILVYEHDIVVVLQPDSTFDAARMS